MRIFQRISFILCLLLLYAFILAGAAAAQLPDLSGGSHDAKDVPAIQFLSGDNDELTRQEVEEIRSLFYREPWLFGPETFVEVGQDLKRLPQQLAQNLRAFVNHDWKQDWFLVAVLLGTLLFFGFIWWLDLRFQRLEELLSLMPNRWPLWLQRLSKVVLVVVGRLALLLLLLFAVHLFWGAYASEQFFFPLLVDILTIFLIYRGIQTLLHEVLITERANLFQEVTYETAGKLYRRLAGFALYSCIFWIGVVALKDLNYRADFVNFLYFIYYASLFAFSVYLISRKSEVFSLFPDIDEPIYQRFVKFFKRFYFYVSSFTLLLGLFWLSGYHRLAETLFLRSWALVGLVLGLRLAHRLIRNLLVSFLAKERQTPSRLINNIMRTLSLIEILLMINGVLALLGIREPLIRLLVQPVASIGEKSVISPLSFINGMLTLIVFWLISQIIDAFLEERVFPQRFDAGVHQMISLTAFYCLMALGALIALNVVGLDLSVFTIFAGALAFGIGFGLQGIAKNFASGVILIFTGLVKKGDYVTVSEKTGYIEDVSWKRVLLRTPDHVDLIIPTVDLVENTIINWSYSGRNVRVHVPVGVSYNSDMNLVKEALLEAAAEHSAIQKIPEPVVWMVEFGDSSVNFELLVWIDCTRITRERLLGELNFMIWNALARHNIEIPFPQRDLHIRSGLEPFEKSPIQQQAALPPVAKPDSDQSGSDQSGENEQASSGATSDASSDAPSRSEPDSKAGK